ncbi:amidase signature enzyme [Lentithecium fluviatile CBS 122367]|uniref:Amidase signature enzyme n=1 Tax=Lentithecium fluviatile CBS 122367 TaxID=1168545 RepID=A0A6G1IDR3_9PLEO|nr:amidase signature enzyme [Lentithecium fluviatile CBS 122367]
MRHLDASIVFRIKEVYYVAISAKPFGITDVNDGSFVTVLERTTSNIASGWLERSIKGHLQSDDVLRREFLEHIVVTGTTDPRCDWEIETNIVSQTWGTKSVRSAAEVEPIVAGPYLVSAGLPWQILRLFHDSQKAFLVALYPSNEDGGAYRSIPVMKSESDISSVAIPSRLAVRKPTLEPLGNFRVAVKDAFDIKGIRTSLGCRAYSELYPPPHATAPAIQCLIDRGARLTGKTKMSMFLSREEPAEAVDVESAWNPRGDGYQGPGGSSSGSAAAVAAYDWLDIGIGTDTNGSIRRPAQCNGCFALRISHDIFPSEGMFTIFKQFDVPGILASDFSKLKTFAQGWYGDNPKLLSKRRSRFYQVIFLTDDHKPAQGSMQAKILAEVIQQLGEFIGNDVRSVSLAALWKSSPPEEAQGETLHEYLDEVGACTFLYENYHTLSNFRDDYLGKFHRDPFVSQFVQWRWNIGKVYTRAQFNEGLRKLEVFRQWFLDCVMQGVPETILVISGEAVRPNYRNDLPSGNYVQPAWHPWWISPILQGPEVVIPIGHVPYQSTISNSVEHLPATLSLLCEKYGDMGLLEFAEQFLNATSHPFVLASGNRMWNSNDNIESLR